MGRELALQRAIADRDLAGDALDGRLLEIARECLAELPDQRWVRERVVDLVDLASRGSIDVEPGVCLASLLAELCIEARADPFDPKLSSILRYKNEPVVRRFATDYGLALATSRRLFVEMLTFLWIANKHLIHLRDTAVGRDREKTFDVLSIWYGLDEMWHTFILFSLDYEVFCQTHFGRYIHHQPAADVPSRSRGRPGHRRDRRHLSLEEYIQFTYETLGRATVVRWFKTYPRTMSRRALMNRRIASLQKQAIPRARRATRSDADA